MSVTYSNLLSIRLCAPSSALTLEDASELWSNSTMIQDILISAKTTENANQATITVYVWGSGG
jgi:hypothetical protein